MTAKSVLRRGYDADMQNLAGAPYNWGGSGPSDCSGDIRKRAIQYISGMPIEDIMQGWADDYATVIDRLESHDE